MKLLDKIYSLHFGNCKSQAELLAYELRLQVDKGTELRKQISNLEIEIKDLHKQLIEQKTMFDFKVAELEMGFNKEDNAVD